jgi:ribosome biogenesis GTPase
MIKLISETEVQQSMNNIRNTIMNLIELGWNSYFDDHFERYKDVNLEPARVGCEHKDRYLVYSQSGEFIAEVSGKFRHETSSRADYPAVGDWVAVSSRPDEGRATIHGLVTRKSSFSRKAVLAGSKSFGGKTDEHVLAANVDVVFLVGGLDGNYNLRRIERYLTIAYDSGASPVIVLNKADLCDDIDSILEEVETVAFGVPVHAVSALKNDGAQPLREHIAEGSTAVFLGSSGVGKSSLINCLMRNDSILTREVRLSDGKGRHTTTRREMYFLPEGGTVIDTPGLRELQLWDDEEGLSKAFNDIEELAAQCRFRDCSHRNEPGCAIQNALREGTLDGDRYRSYRKLQRELAFVERRKSESLQRLEKDKWKQIARKVKQIKKIK